MDFDLIVDVIADALRLTSPRGGQGRRYETVVDNMELLFFVRKSNLIMQATLRPAIQDNEPTVAKLKQILAFHLRSMTQSSDVLSVNATTQCLTLSRYEPQNTLTVDGLIESLRSFINAAAVVAKVLTSEATSAASPFDPNAYHVFR